MMRNSQVTQTVTAKTEDSSSLSKLSKFLAVLIIFFSTTQFGLHFWPSSTLVYGIRIDYLSPTLYFLDFLIILYLVLSRQFRPFGGLQRSERQVGSSAIPLFLTNFLYSHNPLATLSWSLHFLLYLSFALSLRTVLKRNSWLQAKKGSAAAERSVLMGTQTIYDLGFILTLSLLFQTALAATQVYLGHAVGGFMYYLGERMVSLGSPGIALGSFMDQVVLRAYGTFSHPNVLAGYAIISLLIILRLSPATKGSGLEGSSQPHRLESGEGLTLWVSSISTILILLLTQSRSAALVLFGIIIPLYLIKKIKYRLFYFVIVVAIAILNSNFLSPTRSELSSSGRLTLQKLSFSVIRTFPVFGTGAQSSVATYPLVDSSFRLLQPDHNSFTLFLSWFGIFGLLGALYTLRSTTYNLRSLLLILPLLLFDHYLLTSPQGMFILTLYLSTLSPVLNYIHAKKNRK